MTDADAAGTSPAPSEPAGVTLRAAREARGLSLEEVAARTRVPLRHLQAIEASDYSQLPSPTYAVGFARAFARAVGADEVAAANRVRADVNALGRQPDYTPYQIADPARVPSRGLAIAGIGAAVAIIVLAALWFAAGRGGFPGASASSPVPAATVALTAPAPQPSPAAATGGQVRLAATDEVWLRVYDADNKTLYLDTMKPGEHFDVPADARQPMINVGRPDKLQVTLNGSAVPALGTGERPIKDVRVDGVSIAARMSGAPAPVPSASPTASASGRDRPSARRTSSARRAERPRLSETQRANLDSAANGEPAAAPSPSATAGRTP